MSYANGTTHYNLPQTVSTDKRDWTDTNQAFADVDAALYTAADTASTAASNISTLDAQINTPSTGLAAQLATAQQDITSLDGRMDTAEGTITQHTSDIADVRGDLQDAIVAYNEPTATSTHAYAEGDYFFYNDILYKATAAIAIDDTIVPNTNCSATNVMTELVTDVAQINSDLPKYSLIDINHSQTLTTANGTKNVSQLLQDAISNFRQLTIPSGYAWQIKEVIVPTSTTGRTTYNVHEGLRTSISETANIQGDAILRGSASVSMATVSLATPFCASAYINSSDDVGYSDALSNVPNQGLTLVILYDLYKVN